MTSQTAILNAVQLLDAGRYRAAQFVLRVLMDSIPDTDPWWFVSERGVNWLDHGQPKLAREVLTGNRHLRWEGWTR